MADFSNVTPLAFREDLEKLDAKVPDPALEPGDRFLTTVNGALVYADAPASVVVSETAPTDTDVLWVNTEDDTSITDVPDPTLEPDGRVLKTAGGILRYEAETLGGGHPFHPSIDLVREVGWREGLTLNPAFSEPTLSGHTWEAPILSGGAQALMYYTGGRFVYRSDPTTGTPPVAPLLISGQLFRTPVIHVRVKPIANSHWPRRTIIKWLDEDNYLYVVQDYNIIDLRQVEAGVDTRLASWSNPSSPSLRESRWYEVHTWIGMSGTLRVAVSAKGGAFTLFGSCATPWAQEPLKVGLAAGTSTYLWSFTVSEAELL